MDAANGTWKAKRYAVKLDPACVFLEYTDDLQQCRVREVKLSIAAADLDVDRLTKKVIRSFPRKLDRSTVSYRQVRKLVNRLVEHHSSANVKAHAAAAKPSTASTTPKPLAAASGQPGKHAGIDSALDDLDRELADLGLGPSPSKPTSTAPPRPPTTGLVSNGANGQQHRSLPPAHDDRLVLGSDILDLGPSVDLPLDADLNKVPEEELARVKALMDQNFVKNRLKPGDPGYVYDKRVEFQPAGPNEWDEDDDDEPSESAHDSEPEEEIDWEEIARATSKPVQTSSATPRSTHSEDGHGGAQSSKSSADWP